MKRNGLFLLLGLCLFSPNFTLGHTVSSSYLNTELTQIVYKNGILSIQGLTGIGSITVYSIIGNKVVEFSQVPLENFKRNLALDSKTMFILRIETPSEVKTFKLVTR